MSLHIAMDTLCLLLRHYIIEKVRVTKMHSSFVSSGVCCFVEKSSSLLEPTIITEAEESDEWGDSMDSDLCKIYSLLVFSVSLLHHIFEIFSFWVNNPYASS
ncbi:hypothetical protein AVEN_91417-1 [Araneus ventricosus]|uniref:Uncharacterized protein n=1 Tax=Araneus ventricosus TaxID=182803 RepID=A0A4Y2II79_ARAVE|nr:hypothetical protein AVEN_91417-1 [Araneus ventricosus]